MFCSLQSAARCEVALQDGARLLRLRTFAYKMALIFCSVAAAAALTGALVSVSQEEPAPAVRGRRSSLSGVCYLTMGLLVLLLGSVFAAMYVYRYFFVTQVGAGWEGPLAVLEQPGKPLPPRKARCGCVFHVLLCAAAAREPVPWALQTGLVFSGGLRLSFHKPCSSTPSAFVCLFFSFLLFSAF